MSEIVVCRGLPASGKSTWAKAWVAEDPTNRLRVNRDDIRFQLYGKYWDVDEQTVTKVEEAMVKAALDAGKSVVIDATHLAARYIKRWYNYGVKVTVESFEVPLAELYARDIQRERVVTAKVIEGMAQRYQIKADGKLPALPEAAVTTQWRHAAQGVHPAYIVDIDGTIANHSDPNCPIHGRMVR